MPAGAEVVGTHFGVPLFAGVEVGRGRGAAGQRPVGVEIEGLRGQFAQVAVEPTRRPRRRIEPRQEPGGPQYVGAEELHQPAQNGPLADEVQPVGVGPHRLATGAVAGVFHQHLPVAGRVHRIDQVARRRAGSHLLGHPQPLGVVTDRGHNFVGKLPTG